MNAILEMRRWWFSWVAVILCVCAVSLAPAKSSKSVAAAGKCQTAQIHALATYYKAVFTAWSKNAESGADIDAAKAAARLKLQASWDKAIAGAAKQGANCATPTLDSVMTTLDPTEYTLGTGIEGGLALPGADAGKVGSALFTTASGAFTKFLAAYTKNSKTNSTSTLDSDLAKVRASLVATWGKTIAKAESQGVAYSGLTETDTASMLDQMANNLTRMIAEGPIHIQLPNGLVNGGTTNVGQLALTGSVVNPTGDDASGFGGRIVANVNGVDIAGNVSAGSSAHGAQPSKSAQQARARAKIEGRDPGRLAPADSPDRDPLAPVQWVFDITIPMDFGSNTIQIKLYDLNNNLLAASQSWTVFSTTPPADMIATMTWDTWDTDVDLHSSSKALDGSYDYGVYHTCYYNKVSGYNNNMVLDIDNTWGYGPEHITVGQGNPAGETIALKVYYYSDHTDEDFIPTTAYVNVKVHGQTVFDNSSLLTAESTDSDWGEGPQVWDVGEFTLDPTDQYAVTINQVDTSAFPQVTLHVSVQEHNGTSGLTGVDGLTADNFYAINNSYFMTLSSATGSAGDYQLTYTDKTTGKRPVFVAVTKNEGTTIRSGCSDITTYGKSYALCVGINAYEFINPLSYCIADADGVQSALSATQMFSGNDTQVTELTDSAAAKSSVLSAIGDVSSVMKKEDLFVFYFAGHGSQGASENTQTLCMWDTTGSDGQISVAELQTALAPCPYGNVTNVYVFLDACYSGNFIGQRALADAGYQPRCYLQPGQQPRTAAQPFAKTFVRNLSDYNSYFVMSACKGTETAGEIPSLGHGVFTNYFLEALGGSDGTSLGPANANGDVMTTCEEVFAYLQPRVVLFTTASQNPCCYDDDIANPARLKFIW